MDRRRYRHEGPELLTSTVSILTSATQNPLIVSLFCITHTSKRLKNNLFLWRVGDKFLLWTVGTSEEVRA